MLKSKSKKTDGEFLNEELISAALAKAVRKALLFHKQTGNPIYCWENDRIVKKEANEIVVDQLTEAQRNELDKRIDYNYASLDEGASWDEVKKRIKTKTNIKIQD
jgi:hypothetical protein